MTILKDLLALNKPKRVTEQPITEARRSGDMMELIEKWSEQNKAYNWEGERGNRNFEKLIRVLGYSSTDEFFSDNSGAYEALIEWIGSMNNTEWVDAMEEATGGEDEDEDK